MKQKLGVGFAMAIAFACIFTGCKSSPPVPVYPSEPMRSILSEVQLGWNTLVPPVKNPVSGKEIGYKFDGDVWFQQEDGTNIMAGKIILVENADGFTIEMRQTHNYVDKKTPFSNRTIGWQKLSDKQQKTVIKLEYDSSASPPLSVSR